MAEKRDAFGNPIGPRKTAGVPQPRDVPRPASKPQGTNESFGKPRINAGSYGTLSIVILVVVIAAGVAAITVLGIFGG